MFGTAPRRIVDPDRHPTIPAPFRSIGESRGLPEGVQVHAVLGRPCPREVQIVEPTIEVGTTIVSRKHKGDFLLAYVPDILSYQDGHGHSGNLHTHTDPTEFDQPVNLLTAPGSAVARGNEYAR